MKFEQTAAPHWLGAEPVTIMMLRVVLAMLPPLLVASWLLGVGMLLNAAIAVITCLVSEAAALQARGRPLRTFLTDGSAVVTGLIIAFALPPGTAWWVTVIACVFAVVFAKHLYGGLGYNLFNPAMVGYVVVLVSFPDQISVWSAPDGMTGATPLDGVRNGLTAMLTMDEIRATGLLESRDWLWINLAAFAGGVWLLYTGVIRWHIPAAMIGTMGLLYTVFYVFDPATNVAPLTGLASGGLMFTAFFVATDPVSGAASDRGRLLFAAGIGLLAFGLRKWSAYPDGLAFAVLLMNTAAPLIDRYTIPRVSGHRERPRL